MQWYVNGILIALLAVSSVSLAFTWWYNRSDIQVVLLSKSIFSLSSSANPPGSISDSERLVLNGKLD
jgi:hypothetical protein